MTKDGGRQGEPEHCLQPGDSLSSGAAGTAVTPVIHDGVS